MISLLTGGVPDLQIKVFLLVIHLHVLVLYPHCRVPDLRDTL